MPPSVSGIVAHCQTCDLFIQSRAIGPGDHAGLVTATFMCHGQAMSVCMYPDQVSRGDVPEIFPRPVLLPSPALYSTTSVCSTSNVASQEFDEIQQRYMDFAISVSGRPPATPQQRGARHYQLENELRRLSREAEPKPEPKPEPKGRKLALLDE